LVTGARHYNVTIAHIQTEMLHFITHVAIDNSNTEQMNRGLQTETLSSPTVYGKGSVASMADHGCQQPGLFERASWCRPMYSVEGL